MKSRTEGDNRLTNFALRWGTSKRSTGVAARQFVLSAMACLIAVTMVLVGLPAVTANAASGIPVTYTEVDAKTDAAIEQANKCKIPSTGGNIGNYDEKDVQTYPGSLTGGERDCSFVSANYVYTDQSGNEKYNVKLKLAKIELVGENVVLTPDVPAAMAASQQNVKLTIPVTELKSDTNPTSPYRIDLHYADMSSFRRIKLDVDNRAGQPDFNLDGTQFTGPRALLLFDDGSGNFSRPIDVDYPRYTANGIYELTKTVMKGDVKFSEVADVSDKGRTRKQLTITVPASSSGNAAAQLGLEDKDTVTMRADTRTDQAEEYGLINNNKLKLGYQSPFDCGIAGCRAQFKDFWRDAFFYKVTTSRDRARQSNPYYDSIFRRTGIPAVAFNEHTDDLPSWLFTPYGVIDRRPWFEGAELDAQPPRIIDSMVDMPYPVDSVTFDRSHGGSHKTTGDWAPGWLIDNQITADSKWPITTDVQGAMWVRDKSGTPAQYREHTNNNELASVDNRGSDIGTNDAGEKGEVSFYVQYNGLPYRALQASDGYSWSYFLSRVKVNGEWYEVPFPEFPKNPLQVVPSNNGCYGNGWDKSGCTQAGTAGKTYYDARAHMLRNPTKEEKENPVNTTVTADIWGYIGLGKWEVRQCRPGTPDQKLDNVGMPVDNKLLRYQTEVLMPRTLVDRDITSGRNAGSHLKVELVNTRVAGDMLADGMSVLDNLGKKVARTDRHHPSPALGPATQLTNNSVCFDPDGRNPRPQAAWNQWKTMYKITVKGMVNPDLDVTAKYDYTSKPKVWVASSRGTSKVEIKEAADRIGGVLKGTPEWRNRTTVSGSLEEIGCDGKKCDGAVGYDMPYASETADGNIRVELRDGYINPELKVFKNRTETGICGSTDTKDNCQIVRENGVRLKAPAAAVSSSGDLWSDGKFHYVWKYNDVESEPSERADTGSNIQIGTATATPIRVDSTVVRTPVVVMKNESAGDLSQAAVANKSTAAPASVIDQWNGAELKNRKYASDAVAPDIQDMPWADKQTQYYLKVAGNVPADQDHKAFTGYKLIGILATPTGGNKAEELLDGKRFYPGDAIDLRTATGTDAKGKSGGKTVSLSNDAFDGARYSELQLVPTFGKSSSGAPRLYEANNYSKNNGEEKEEGNAFSFYAAPGLTASLVTANYKPAEHKLASHPDYVYSQAVSRESKWLPKPDSTKGQEETLSSEALKFVYLDQSKKLVLKGTVNPVVGGASNVDGTEPNLGGDDPEHQWPLLQAWVKNSTDSDSTADYFTPLTVGKDGKATAELSVPEAGDQNLMNTKEGVWIDWHAPGKKLPEYYAADAWSCSVPVSDLTPAMQKEGASDPGQPAGDDRSTSGSSSGEGYGTVRLKRAVKVATPAPAVSSAGSRVQAKLFAGKTTTCVVGFHAAQLSIVTDGLGKNPDEDVLKSIKATSTDANTSVTASGDVSAFENSKDYTTAVKPGVKWKLEAPGLPSGKRLDGWKHYTGKEFTADALKQDENWEKVDKPESVTLAADKHEIYAPVYKDVVFPALPRTGGSAATTFLILGTAILGVGLAWMLYNERRRKALAGEVA